MGTDDLPVSEFGFPGPLRDKLVAAILRGEKTSTTGLHEEYLREGTPISGIGERSLVVDSDGRGVAMIETTGVEVRRMGDVDLQFAIDEGERLVRFAYSTGGSARRGPVTLRAKDIERLHAALERTPGLREALLETRLEA